MAAMRLLLLRWRSKRFLSVCLLDEKDFVIHGMAFRLGKRRLHQFNPVYIPMKHNRCKSILSFRA